MGDFPARLMRSAGIVQEGDPLLRRPARHFTLPAERETALDVIAQLRAAMDRVARVHQFAKGMGMAAPQIGLDHAAAVIRPPTGPELVLLNPRIVATSDDQDTHYEGCLSFFDVRGLVTRYLSVDVQHRHGDGTVAVTRFTGPLARHVQHEIDHLEGHLYTDRMPPGTHPIPLSEYRGTGHSWK